MKWGKDIEEIAKEVARELDLDEFLVKDAIEDCFRNIKYSLAKPELPKVLLHSFGSFVPNKNKVKKRLKIWKYKYDKTGDPIYLDKIEKLEPVYKRLKDG